MKQERIKELEEVIRVIGYSLILFKENKDLERENEELKELLREGLVLMERLENQARPTTY